jgi:hypothetical protein
MNKETLRIQLLSGVITESEYKAKLTENKSSSKETLKENFVGMGMVGNIFDREKTDYELAFEHFTKGASLNEMEDEMPKAPSLEETDADLEENIFQGEDVMPKFRAGVLKQLIAYAEKEGSSKESIDDLKAALARIEAEIEAEKNKKPLPR